MSLHYAKPNDTELAKLAYAAVEGVPTVEPNDRNRLGYHVWLYLRGEVDSLEEAVKQARSRYKPRTMEREEVVRIVRSALDDIRAAVQEANTETSDTSTSPASSDASDSASPMEAA